MKSEARCRDEYVNALLATPKGCAMTTQTLPQNTPDCNKQPLTLLEYRIKWLEERRAYFSRLAEEKNDVFLQAAAVGLQSDISFYKKDEL